MRKGRNILRRRILLSFVLRCPDFEKDGRTILAPRALIDRLTLIAIKEMGL